MPVPEPCSYVLLPNQVHCIVLHESSRRAVDQWLGLMTDLMYMLYTHSDNAYAAVLIDLREPGMIPVAYATHAVRLWTQEYTRPPYIDVALVYRYGLLASLAVSLANLSRIPDGVRLFHNGRYDDALQWLEQRAMLDA